MTFPHCCKASRNMTGQRRITLVSSDDQSFELAEEAAVLSKLVENTLDDDEDEDESAPEPIHLPRVSSACLTQVVSFLNHHVEEPMTEIPIPLGGRTFAEVRCTNVLRTNRRH